MQSARVKGSKITSKVAFVRDVYGERVLAAVVASLAEEDRDTLANLVQTAWYPQDLYERVLVAVCTVAANGDESVYDQIGADSADRQLRGVYRAFSAPDDPGRVLTKMAPMHGLLNDPGEMEVILRGDSGCTILVRKPRSTPVACRVARAFYRRTVEQCEVLYVRVEEPQCSGLGAPACRFEISWRRPRSLPRR